MIFEAYANEELYNIQFNKDKATATYGVLPAANVPPPYALASISALQFDHFGHRFSSAALDGTVCTWQLEVGGRSNVRPTESSLCFNGQASYVLLFLRTELLFQSPFTLCLDVNIWFKIWASWKLQLALKTLYFPFWFVLYEITIKFLKRYFSSWLY